MPNITNPSVDTTEVTGGSLWSEQYWNGGSGQANWSDTTKYWQDSGGISTTDIPLAIRLLNSGGHTLVNSGYLDSSTFDTGSSSTSYTTLNWQPTSQDPSATVKFQVATNNDNATWNYIGPDGTSSTYYTTPGGTINSTNNNNEYIRYRAYLSTTDDTKNPTVTSVGINYVAGCFTPGHGKVRIELSSRAVIPWEGCSWIKEGRGAAPTRDRHQTQKPPSSRAHGKPGRTQYR